MTTENATTANETKATEFVPQSDKLSQLREAAKSAWAEVVKHADPFAEESRTAKMAYLKIEGEMNAEISALKKAENDRVLAEKRNERIALNTKQLEAYAALLQLPKNATQEQKDAAKLAFDSARDTVETELLAKYGASKSVSVSANGSPKSETGESKSATRAQIVELYLQGKKHAEIEAMGFPRSTVWHAINDYKKANGQ